MKALQTALLVLLIITVLTGCALRSELHVSEAASSAAVHDYNDLAGTYLFETREVDEPYRPKLVLNADGTFEFTVNLLTQMGNIDGTYSADGSTVLLTVETIDFDGFQGEHVKTITFDVSSDKNLMYRSTDSGDDQPIGMTNPYDLFKKI
ncbi:hypothetical protein V6615_02380 [Oscillospiraceae bacterium PP1C4]